MKRMTLQARWRSSPSASVENNCKATAPLKNWITVGLHGVHYRGTLKYMGRWPAACSPARAFRQMK
ncbi:MAG: hypothetical protein BA869_05465 [Desulfuromonadales bacterium C00003107]|jgi:hypothetical protein|nr:MAG: hypothetical protein BA869_05465 [Desulfuromonadales bacterium C00003107]